MTTSHSRQTSGTTRRAARQMSGRGHVLALARGAEPAGRARAYLR
jgi:hypothetical protein